MKEYGDLRVTRLRLSTAQFALLIGCDERDVVSIERRAKHTAFAEALYALIDYDTALAMRGLLHKCAALRRWRSLTEKNINTIKGIAKSHLGHNEYITWEELFDKRLLEKRMAGKTETKEDETATFMLSL
jgi:hypothetical protein